MRENGSIDRNFGLGTQQVIREKLQQRGIQLQLVKMNLASSSPSSSPAAAAAAHHDASTAPSTTVFAPPPLPSYLAAPCRPGFHAASRQPSGTPPGSQLPPAAPRAKFRRCAWSKIPTSRAHARNTVWSTSDRLFRDGVKLDYERIEELFSLTAAASPAPLSPSSSTGVKYPAAPGSAAAAAGPQELASRAPSSSSTPLQPRTHSAEVSSTRNQ